MSTSHVGSGRPADQPSMTAESPAMSEVLAQNWWAIALRGVFAILFGVIAFAAPGAAILSLVLLFSAYMLVDGIFAIVAGVRAARAHERWKLLVAEGIINIITGVLAFLLPGLTAIAFVLLVAAWAVVSGGLMWGAAYRLGKGHGRWWLAFGGLVSVVFGALLVIAPLVGAVVLTWWMAAYAIVFGVVLLALAFKLRARRGEGASRPTIRTAPL
jgi:uncharacterized membrane protein HdeD (DUF308 family)